MLWSQQAANHPLIRSVFVGAGADRFCGAHYPGGADVHHPGISPDVNGEKPWILFKT